MQTPWDELLTVIDGFLIDSIGDSDTLNSEVAMIANSAVFQVCVIAKAIAWC